MITIISPHLDDAVLSCGQLISAMQNVHVETVFAGVPAHVGLTSYDRNSGWSASDEAMLGRRAEDLAALAVLRAGSVHHEWLDQQYIEDRHERDADVRAWMRATLQPGKETFIVPLGLGHPDHIAVAHAARVAAQNAGFPIYAYEELPYRVLDPMGAVDRIRQLETEWTVKLSEFPIGSGQAKASAIECYRSQLWNLNVNACLVPERFWKLTAK